MLPCARFLLTPRDYLARIQPTKTPGGKPTYRGPPLAADFAVKLSQLRAFLLLRYTLIIATAYLLLVELSFAVPPTAAMLLIVLALLSNVVFAGLPERVMRSVAFNMAVIVYDTIWVTATLVLSGRFSAEFFYLYFFVLLLAAIGENLLLIAVGACALCGAYLYGHVATGGTWSWWHSPSLIRLPFLFATAVFYGYLVDRTRQERRRADESERLARQLERTVAELRVLYAKAQESDRVKSEFLASVSHEFRTPLVALLGYVDLLLEGAFEPLQPGQEDALGRARTAGRNLHQLITRVLEASHIEFEHERVTPGECDLNALFGELRIEFGDTASTTVHYPAHVDVPALHTDAAKLRTILRNLIENAIKYTPEGEVSIEARFDPPNDRVEIRVSDTGIGIAADDLPHVFEAFRQGVDQSRQGGSGVGLGLYIVRRLVTVLGGDVTVESRPGKGSTFRLRLPRVLPPSAESGAPSK